MRCPSCQTPAGRGDSFCSRCGQPLGKGTQLLGSTGVSPVADLPLPPSSTASGEQRLCPRCGVIAPLTAVRCQQCGCQHQGEVLVVADLADACFWVGVQFLCVCAVCRHESPIVHLGDRRLELCLKCGDAKPIDWNSWRGAIAHAHAVGDLTGPNPEGRFQNPQLSIAAENSFAKVGLSEAQRIAEFGHHAPHLQPREAHRLRADAAPGHPLCEICHWPMYLDSVLDGTLTCHCSNPDCAVVRGFVFSRPEWLETPELLGVLGVGQRRDLTVAVLGDDGLARCPTCSAHLPVNSASPFVSCPQCTAMVELSSDQMQRLGFDKPRTETLWLLFRGPSAFRKKLERRTRKSRARAERRVEQPLFENKPRVVSVPPAASWSSLESPPTRRLPTSTPQPTPSPARPPHVPPKAVAPRALFAAGLGVPALVACLAWWLSSGPGAQNTLRTSASALSPERTFSIGWRATVQASTIAAVPQSTRCEVHAKVVEGKFDSLQLRCADRALYSSLDPATGTTQKSSDLQTIRQGGGLQYQLRYSDLGPHPGRGELELDTSRATAELKTPAGSLTLAVDPASFDG